MDATWEPLLALWNASGRQRGRLAKRLAKEGPACLEALAIELDSEAWRQAKAQLRAIEAKDIVVVPPWHLPPSLKTAQPWPLALFVRGSVDLLGHRAVAIVGSRNASVTAERWAAMVAEVSAEAGWLVVSGGARGVDGAAHRGALSTGRPTLAYLGVPADRIYPAEQAELFRAILRRGGSLVSEHPPSVQTRGSDHAKRNRFIAAHAERLYIAEAAERSGTLSTATYARRFGTPVWVSPADIGDERAGLDQLLDRGEAQILEAPDGSPPSVTAL